MKMENRKTYLFFKHELEELLKQGFSREQAFLVLKRIHHAISDWGGYHYTHIDHTAGESLNYLIKQVTEETEAQELKEHILDNAITYGFSPEDEQSRAELQELVGTLEA